ncbi:hypothetical protein GCM10010191_57650 [Actinomadura vinacea]|uniref:Uncharacterized protein n=1 Tax=Actinomadura vinacea TaxID=115336 RepID=A0ABN3JNC7_9ACTN
MSLRMSIGGCFDRRAGEGGGHEGSPRTETRRRPMRFLMMTTDDGAGANPPDEKQAAEMGAFI